MPSTTSSPQRLAGLDAPFGGRRRCSRAARRCRRSSWPAGTKRIAFQPASISVPGLLDHLRRPARRAWSANVGMQVALLAAQQFVDRHAECLALDVVQRDVDRRDGRLQHPAALEILAAIHLLPDARRSASGRCRSSELAIVLDGADHRLLAAGQPAFAPAEDALVGLDLDERAGCGMPTQTG